jgi:hypothetical protein
MGDEAQLTPIPPRKEDVLYGKGVPSDWSNAHVNITWGDPEVGYTEGYRRGARLLVEHVMERQRDQDYLVYPVIFLYRHHIELALKNIIRHTPYIIDRPLTEAEEKHLGKHRLDLLWQDLKPLFAGVCKAAGWDKPDAADEEGVDSHIRQLTALDPDSYSSRYTRSKKGAPSLPAELKYINLQHFAEMVERLADYLDALDTAVTVLEEGKIEMEYLNPA